MRDPIIAFDTIKDNYIRYVETAFDTKFISVNAERRVKLNTDKVLYREPWIEPLPDYKSSDLTISQLTKSEVPNMTDKELEAFRSLVKTGLFSDSFPMYAHQANMLKQAMNKKHCIITSGTGSGKTESFLLPLYLPKKTAFPFAFVPNQFLVSSESSAFLSRLIWSSTNAFIG